MKFNDMEIAMCKLVSFVDDCIWKMNSCPENELPKIEEIFEEFKTRFKIHKKAKLYLAKKPSPKSFNYMSVSADNIWEFAIDTPEFMIIKVCTDGSIHLDEGSAEVIFNYIND